MLQRLEKFFSHWTSSITIFPIPYLILIFATCFMMYYIHITDIGYNSYREDTMFLVMGACAVALPLTLAPSLINRIATQFNKPLFSGAFKTILLQLVGIGFGIIYYLTIPTPTSEYTHEQIYVIGSILIAWIVPFLTIARYCKKQEIRTRVWRTSYKTSLLLGLAGGLILRGGLSACVASLNYLFDIKIDSSIYGYLASISMIFVAGSIWLIHISQQDHTNTTPQYSKTMRLFGHYIFLPLTLIYGAILISYGIKILTTGIRPQGTVVYMVAGYIAFGIGTRYATYIAPQTKNNKLIHTILFISFLLTSLLMIKAIYLRVEQYGFTFDRYFVLMFIITVVTGSILALIFPKNRLLIGLSTVTLFSLIAVFGIPFNAINVVKNSQLSILTKTLHQNNISLPLQSGSLAEIASGDAAKIYSSMSYLTLNYSIKDRDKSILSEEIKTSISNMSHYKQLDYILNATALQYDHYNPGYYLEDEKGSYFSFYTNAVHSTPVDISGYSSLYKIDHQPLDKRDNIVFLRLKDQTEVYIDITPYLPEIYTLSKDTNTKGFEIIDGNYKLILSTLYGYHKFSDTGDTYTTESIEGYLLVK